MGKIAIEKSRQTWSGQSDYTDAERLDMSNFCMSIIELLIEQASIEHMAVVPVMEDGRLTYAKRACRMTIEKFETGHNDVKVFFADDYVSKHILRNVLDEWKADDPATGRAPIISRYYGNGYGTACIIPLQ